MRYLGLDLGTKTLGVSLSDRLGLIASTYKTIRFNENDYESALKELKEIISEFKVEKIVLGLPKNMNNSLGFASERSMNFKKMIEEKYNIEGVNNIRKFTEEKFGKYSGLVIQYMFHYKRNKELNN